MASTALFLTETDIAPGARLSHVRRVAHSLGLRYRLIQREMPGTPHLVFPKYRALLFVCDCGNSCGYRHGCELDVDPWGLNETSSRRRRLQLDVVLWTLRKRGWKASALWACETYHEDLSERISDLVMSSAPPSPEVTLPDDFHFRRLVLRTPERERIESFERAQAYFRQLRKRKRPEV